MRPLNIFIVAIFLIGSVGFAGHASAASQQQITANSGVSTSFDQTSVSAYVPDSLPQSRAERPGQSTAARELTREEQIRIINNYLYVTGQAGKRPEALGETAPADDSLPIKSGTPAILQFLNNRDKLDKDLLLSLGVQDIVRPDLPLFYDSPEGHFRIHYSKTGTDSVYQSSVDSDGDGVPNYIESMALIADSVYNKVINGLGFPAPAPDSQCTDGEDAKYDIYVRNLSANIFGQTFPEYDCRPDPATNYQVVPAFLELDNDYQSIREYRDRPLDAVRVTVAHEFFHAIQFGMDYTESYGNMYWLEMSATWMEEYAYDNINDYYSYLPFFYDVPRTSIQQFMEVLDLHPYASVVFPIYLSEKFGPAIVRAIWEYSAESVGGQFLTSAQRAIDSASGGTMSFGSAFAEFAVWNYFTGPRALYSPNGIGFSERVNYPPIPDSAMAVRRNYPFAAQPNTNPDAPEHNAAAYIRLEDTRVVQEDRFWYCEPSIRRSTICGDSSRATEVTDTLLNPGNPYDVWDSLFTVECPYEGLRVFDATHTNVTATYPWGVSVIYQLDAIPDSFLVESYMIPSLPQSLYSAVDLSTYRVNRFRSITLIFSPASQEASFYNLRTTIDLGYIVNEIGNLDSSRVGLPVAMLLPYPNPAVLDELGGDNLKFRFQMATDSVGLDIYQEPYFVIDIFTVAGERVRTIDVTPTVYDEVDPNTGNRVVWYEDEWDFTNEHGKEIVSGVYLCYARLYSDYKKKSLLAEDKVKVAVIR